MIDVVTIDGPVGVGKSSVAARLAARLGWRRLDTGAMYRAVALQALRQGVSPRDDAACGRLADRMKLEMSGSEDGQRIVLDGEDVTEAIRSAEVTAAVSEVADQPLVREELRRRQRQWVEAAPTVVEGRDMGTIVFPRARWKFFLDADPMERARRRNVQLGSETSETPDEELLASIAERDLRDRTRPDGALRVAEDAVIFDTTHIDLDRVVDTLAHMIGADMGPAP